MSLFVSEKATTCVRENCVCRNSVDRILDFYLAQITAVCVQSYRQEHRGLCPLKTKV